MLQLKKITKKYKSDNFKQTALYDVDLTLRDSEFVSILGPSGSGKTTMLNIIGGLDVYSEGDLIINGVSTKKFKNIDWDTYRNHNVGFVFQSYNLIGHQSILANVELALTISGVSKKERRKRAKAVLEKVGLGEHLRKKPNQLSGGQMQRVAIARALVNNPDILLADEPTGALDSETSVTIMELLKEIAQDKLVIMVTHNPELAKEYSTRIVNILDGKIISDSMPYDGSKEEKNKQKLGKKFMSLKTALSLSFNNLLTKKGRTIMTSFAGSIGIIGIALILSLSNGVQKFINNVEKDTLSSYPITIEDQSMDLSSFMSGIVEVELGEDFEKAENTIYSNDIMVDMISLMTSQMLTNNLAEFKKYIESDKTNINEYLSAVKYSYDLDLQLYKNSDSEVIQVNPSPVFDEMSGGNASAGPPPMAMGSNDVWVEMIDNDELAKNQYELLGGEWADEYNEVMLLVNSNEEISDYTLYTLGLKDQSELNEMMKKAMRGEVVENSERMQFTYDELLDLSYKLIFNTDYFAKEGNGWVNKNEDAVFMQNLLKNAPEIKVVGIIKEDSDTPGGILYRSDLTEYVINHVNESEIAKSQLENPKINILTGMEFSDDMQEFDPNTLTDEEKAYMSTLSDEELAQLMVSYSQNAGTTYDDVVASLGIVDLEKPSSINIYPKNFEAKTEIENIINSYNDEQKLSGNDQNVITYIDYIGLMMSSVTTIIDMISYVLISFVSISLIVSSIMIGIITYISVLERTKEIGILRAIGASKKDISRVFNAETFIVGLFSGVLGIAVTIGIYILASSIIKVLTGVANIALLPVSGAIVLIVISVLLTLLAGLIPSKVASRKNPVEALRTE